VAKRIRVSGTVASVTETMAMVKPAAGASISTTAMMIDAGTQYNGMPLDSFLSVGLELSGEWDQTAMRFFPDFGNWSESRFLEQFPMGTIVLGLVAAVTRQTADVRVHPSLSIEMKRDDVSTNPKDVIDHLWSKGDIVSVRVIRDPSGRLRLRHTDVDDDEPIATAPPVIDGGEPWLTKSKMDLIDSTKELWERERREAEEFTKALDVLSDRMQLDIDDLERALGSIGTDTGQIPVVGSSTSTSDKSVRDKSLGEFTAKQIQRMITNYKVELGKLVDQNRRLTEALSAKTRREGDLAEQAESLRGQLSRARQELQDANKRDHSGSSESLSVADRRSRYGTVEEWIREEIRAFWIGNYTPDDRATFPLDRQSWRVLPSFILTFQTLTDDGKDKAIKTATHIVTGRNAIEHITEDHPLREGDENSKPEVVRDDGALARRAYIESHTAQSRRLHYWKLRDGSIELSRVGLHDDFTP
jgi:predicted  nucleic acid-binding Zn-ribbon protein